MSSVMTTSWQGAPPFLEIFGLIGLFSPSSTFWVTFFSSVSNAISACLRLE